MAAAIARRAASRASREDKVESGHPQLDLKSTRWLIALHSFIT